ncbi:MAG: hypothetical protein NZM44_07655 [Candidatus Calescibacterium sp.]|nr:hypothetical protein [Candidatus Calescibacterium sp.]
MNLEHKHGPVWIQQFVSGNITANQVLLRLQNNTDNVWYVNRLRIIQSVSNNNAQTGFRIEVLNENTTAQDPAVGQDFDFTANTRVFTLNFTTPIVVRPRQILNVRAGGVINGTAPANPLTSVLLT